MKVLLPVVAKLPVLISNAFNLAKFEDVIVSIEFNLAIFEAVIVSTESEGNFPTQLTEALTLGKPTLSAFIEVITQEIGPESLLHFEPGTIESLYTQMKFLLENLSSESHRSVVAYDTFIKESDVKAKKALKQIIEEMGRY